MSSSTVLITHPDCLDHETPQGHPEQIARLEVLLKALELLPVEVLSAPLAQEADLLSVVKGCSQRYVLEHEQSVCQQEQPAGCEAHQHSPGGRHSVCKTDSNLTGLYSCVVLLSH